MPPLTVYVDNQAVVDGVSKGEEWCTRSGASCAALWRRVWAILRDLEGQEIAVQKIKAHTTWLQVLARVISHEHHVGNGLADQAAKEAQRAAENASPTAGVRSQMKRAVLWLKWAMKYTVGWAKDIDIDEGEKEARVGGGGPRLRTQQEGRLVNKLGHEVWIRGKKAVCRRCESSWQAESRSEESNGAQCKGSAAGRAAEEVTGNINYRWACFARTSVEMLEAGAKLVAAPHPLRGWFTREAWMKLRTRQANSSF